MNPNEQPMMDLFEEDELDRLFDIAFPPPTAQSTFEDSDEQPSVLIMFMEACLMNRGWSRQDLADSMVSDIELVNAIFDGTIPESEIEGDLLEDLAHAVGYEPVILELMLDYTRTPQTNLNELVEKLVHFAVDGGTLTIEGGDISFEAEELHNIQAELADLLLQGFGGYYTAEKEDDRKQRILYDRVIKAIKAAITSYQADIEETRAMIQTIKDNYRAEIKSIQTMIEELRAVQEEADAIIPEDMPHDLLKARIIIERLENM